MSETYDDRMQSGHLQKKHRHQRNNVFNSINNITVITKLKRCNPHGAAT